MSVHFHVLTIFPEIFPGPLKAGVIGRALEAGIIGLHIHFLRDFTSDKHRSVDDYPYGGGPGMIMKPEPVFECLDTLENFDPLVILLSPQGVPWTQKRARELLNHHKQFAFICGRYEGVDERIREKAAHVDISIGDYVISGGELAAMVLIETMGRMVPGVVGDRESVKADTFANNLLKYPQYTRPRRYRGMDVPEILLSGNHEAIRKWREEQAGIRTMVRRPDLFSCNPVSNDATKPSVPASARKQKKRKAEDHHGFLS